MRDDPSTGYLEVGNAALYHERRGSGPTILMIPGEGRDAGLHSGVAAALADAFTVITFDRRGNSRSRVAGEEQDLVIAEQSRDAKAVLDAAAVDSAVVFGSAGGASIGLDLAARYPGSVSALIAHEPTTVTVLPAAHKRIAYFEEIARVSRCEGLAVAVERFLAAHGASMGYAWRQGLATRSERDRDSPQLSRRIGWNWGFTLRRELIPFVSFRPDNPALRERRTPIVLTAGRASRGWYYQETAMTLASALDARFAELPGDHRAYLDDPGGFASALRALVASASLR